MDLASSQVAVGQLHGIVMGTQRNAGSLERSQLIPCKDAMIRDYLIPAEMPEKANQFVSSCVKIYRAYLGLLELAQNEGLSWGGFLMSGLGSI